MYKTFLATVFAASLAGCAASPPYGNFIQDSTVIQNQAMATDAVAQLVKLHLPARTRLDMQQDTPDAFGIALVEDLRAQGYAVMEFPLDGSNTLAAPDVTLSAMDTIPMPSSAAPQLRTYPLRYVLDQFPGSPMYRVILIVGPQSLTRAYVAQNDAVVAASAWVRKE